MSPYKHVINALDIRPEAGTSQQFDWLYLLLVSLDATDDSVTSYSNPFAEVVRRLSVFEPTNGFALQEIKKIFGARL